MTHQYYQGKLNKEIRKGKRLKPKEIRTAPYKEFVERNRMYRHDPLLQEKDRKFVQMMKKRVAKRGWRKVKKVLFTKKKIPNVGYAPKTDEEKMNDDNVCLIPWVENTTNSDNTTGLPTTDKPYQKRFREETAPPTLPSNGSGQGVNSTQAPVSEAPASEEGPVTIAPTSSSTKTVYPPAWPDSYNTAEYKGDLRVAYTSPHSDIWNEMYNKAAKNYVTDTIKKARDRKKAREDKEEIRRLRRGPYS